MSASAPRSRPAGGGTRARPAGGRFAALTGAATVWLLLAAAGCSSTLMFDSPRDTGTGSGAGGGAAGQIGGGGQIGGTGGQIGGTGGAITPPADAGRDTPQPPPDAGPDLPADNGPGDTGDVAPRPDVPPDRQPEVPSDVRDVPPDTLPPGTCNVEADCHANLHCDVATHLCQECVTSAHCAANATNKVCNTALTPNRCVECVDTSSCLAGVDHPTMCFTDNYRCGVGCDDSPNTCLGGLICDTSTLDHICTECPTGSCAGSPKGPFCFGARVCVQCMTMSDCAGTPGTPMCDLITGLCVRCRTSNDCPATAPLCNPVGFTCVP